MSKPKQKPNIQRQLTHAQASSCKCSSSESPRTLDERHRLTSKLRKSVLQHLAHVGRIVAEVYRILEWWSTFLVAKNGNAQYTILNVGGSESLEIHST
jgi:hypothetical protein